MTVVLDSSLLFVPVKIRKFLKNCEQLDLCSNKKTVSIVTTEKRRCVNCLDVLAELLDCLQAAMSSGENVDGKSAAVSLRGVLRIVTDARNAHGLRLQDPARYNTHCARHILSLKKTLKFVQRGKKSPPKPVTVDLVAQDPRSPPEYFQILTLDMLRLCCSPQKGHGVKVQV